MRTSPLTVVATVLTSGILVAASIAHAASGPIMSAARPGEPAARLQVPTDTTTMTDDEVAARLLAELINAERAKYGLAPYQFDEAAAATATAHSVDQATMRKLSHAGSDGSNAGERLTRFGVTWTSWGENVGAGFATPGPLLQAWLDSPTHRPILLSTSFTRVGVGVAASSNGTRYWTMDTVG